MSELWKKRAKAVREGGRLQAPLSVRPDASRSYSYPDVDTPSPGMGASIDKFSPPPKQLTLAQQFAQLGKTDTYANLVRPMHEDSYNHFYLWDRDLNWNEMKPYDKHPAFMQGMPAQHSRAIRRRLRRAARQAIRKKRQEEGVVGSDSTGSSTDSGSGSGSGSTSSGESDSRRPPSASTPKSAKQKHNNRAAKRPERKPRREVSQLDVISRVVKQDDTIKEIFQEVQVVESPAPIPSPVPMLEGSMSMSWRSPSYRRAGSQAQSLGSPTDKGSEGSAPNSPTSSSGGKVVAEPEDDFSDFTGFKDLVKETRREKRREKRRVAREKRQRRREAKKRGEVLEPESEEEESEEGEVEGEEGMELSDTDSTPSSLSTESTPTPSREEGEGEEKSEGGADDDPSEEGEEGEGEEEEMEDEGGPGKKRRKRKKKEPGPSPTKRASLAPKPKPKPKRPLATAKTITLPAPGRPKNDHPAKHSPPKRPKPKPKPKAKRVRRKRRRSSMEDEGEEEEGEEEEEEWEELEESEGEGTAEESTEEEEGEEASEPSEYRIEEEDLGVEEQTRFDRRLSLIADAEESDEVAKELANAWSKVRRSSMMDNTYDYDADLDGDEDNARESREMRERIKEQQKFLSAALSKGASNPIAPIATVSKAAMLLRAKSKFLSHRKVEELDIEGLVTFFIESIAGGDEACVERVHEMKGHLVKQIELLTANYRCEADHPQFMKELARILKADKKLQALNNELMRSQKKRMGRRNRVRDSIREANTRKIDRLRERKVREEKRLAAQREKNREQAAKRAEMIEDARVRTQKLRAEERERRAAAQKVPPPPRKLRESQQRRRHSRRHSISPSRRASRASEADDGPPPGKGSKRRPGSAASTLGEELVGVVGVDSQELLVPLSPHLIERVISSTGSNLDGPPTSKGTSSASGSRRGSCPPQAQPVSEGSGSTTPRGPPPAVGPSLAGIGGEGGFAMPASALLPPTMTAHDIRRDEEPEGAPPSGSPLGPSALPGLAHLRPGSGTGRPPTGPGGTAVRMGDIDAILAQQTADTFVDMFAVATPSLPSRPVASAPPGRGGQRPGTGMGRLRSAKLRPASALPSMGVDDPGVDRFPQLNRDTGTVGRLTKQDGKKRSATASAVGDAEEKFNFDRASLTHTATQGGMECFIAASNRTAPPTPQGPLSATLGFCVPGHQRRDQQHTRRPANRTQLIVEERRNQQIVDKIVQRREQYLRLKG